jgi:hypothetical protein
MASGAPVLRTSVHRGRSGLSWCSSQFPDVLDTEVDDAQDVFLRGSFTAWLYLAAKPSHVGVNVDGLAYLLHCPMVHSC